METDAWIQALTDMAARYWAGEAEVVRTYFSQPRTREEHIRWLTLQCYKEIYGSGIGDARGLIYGPIERLREMYPRLATDVSRREFLAQIGGMHDEFRHYTLFADLLEELTGERISPAWLKDKQFPEDKILTEMRFRIRSEEGALGEAANEFTEGGGCSMFWTGMQLNGGEFERRVAAACRTVYEDEIGHMMHGVRDLPEVVQGEADWQKVAQIVRAISRQRVRMRNEQFGFPLSEQRLAAIDAGQIEPLRPAELAPAALASR